MPKKTEIRIASEAPAQGLRSKAKRGDVIFGRVTVSSGKLKEDIVARNVAAGQSALKRAADKLARPGISLRASKGVPLYYVDDARPKQIVRELDGNKAYGTFLNGKFVLSNG